MSEFGSQIIFKQLLQRHQRIQIPMIQRDFAQGRPMEKDVRDDFLSALHGAFMLPPEDESLPLNLDFIYGSVEGGEITRFLPLDGQQRLTTLFLLHWYLAWKDGCLDGFQEIFCQGKESRFSYSVRPSSVEFFDALANFIPILSPGDVPSLMDMITNQSWYFRYWRLDPTIQSSLTMLDAIHARFRETDASFSRLLNDENPVITFQLLDLNDFGLSDDLYIKMNARGKPLTVFETFKARYEQELSGHFYGETKAIGDQRFTVAEFFARRMDTQWADFFWNYRDEETSLYDEAVMNLFHAVALVTRDPESESYLESIAALRNKWQKSSYTAFHQQGWLDRNFSEVLFVLLETWSKGGNGFTSALPDTRYFDEITLFKKAVKEPVSLSYTELVQLFGYVVFIREHSGSVDPKIFQEWMRIIVNLSANMTYERPADMQRSIAAIVDLIPHSRDILGYFAAADKPTAGFTLQQVAEEKLKAELIQANVSWRALIDRAEQHGYFNGQIEFLFDFCGVLSRWKGFGMGDWSAEEHALLQKHFESYFKKSEAMFNARGLASIEEYRWERALLSLGDYLLPGEGQNYSFLVNSSTDPASWKRLLRGSGHAAPEARKILQLLLDSLDAEGSLKEQLDEIIAAAVELEPWRQALVETPEAFEYCGQRYIRWISPMVYLLKKCRMSGAHAELFSYALHKKLSADSERIMLLPLRLLDYESVSASDYEPCLRLRLKDPDFDLSFSVCSSDERFKIDFDRVELSGFTILEEVLVNEFEFSEEDGRLTVLIERDDIRGVLHQIAGTLKGLNLGVV
jgi:hypothetical protein